MYLKKKGPTFQWWGGGDKDSVPEVTWSVALCWKRWLSIRVQPGRRYYWSDWGSDIPALRAQRLLSPWVLRPRGAALRLLSQYQCSDQPQALTRAQRWWEAELPTGTKTHPGIPEHQPFPRRTVIQDIPCLPQWQDPSHATCHQCFLLMKILPSRDCDTEDCWVSTGWPCLLEGQRSPDTWIRDVSHSERG